MLLYLLNKTMTEKKKGFSDFFFEGLAGMGPVILKITSTLCNDMRHHIQKHHKKTRKVVSNEDEQKELQ